jgi:hypothetical protein
MYCLDFSSVPCTILSYSLLLSPTLNFSLLLSPLLSSSLLSPLLLLSYLLFYFSPIFYYSHLESGSITGEARLINRATHPLPSITIPKMRYVRTHFNLYIMKMSE